ncbi:hypothetical protein CORC01_08851 [Colletotrichum orchidophilum]|uniref:Uncharacterized protein n=1 Tax=Colletotrichum orchidophilum TaxID=1209926 RepID=A0A1G4B390_9PEZI|nr:uncharacterized protein CORC01_08851 [Colletotrichum orchidophilum]OHE95854.1 hypothetical protein CORC01_08851 [Colletotrichum orchidophilum]
MSQKDWLQEKKYFETSFPMAIGRACTTFTILRNKCHIHLGTEEDISSATFQSCPLPLDFLEHTEGLGSLNHEAQGSGRNSSTSQKAESAQPSPAKSFLAALSSCRIGNTNTSPSLQNPKFRHGSILRVNASSPK